MLVPFLGLTQSNYKISIGSSIQFDYYSYKEYISNSNSIPGEYQDKSKLGISFNFNSNYQNRYFLGGVEVGIINTSPIDNFSLMFLPKFNAALNLNYNDKELKLFIGPFVKSGVLMSYSPNILSLLSFDYRLITYTGLTLLTKFFQVEIGTTFRKKYSFSNLPVYKNSLCANLGVRIPLKKIN